jgi:hypothetical protein
VEPWNSGPRQPRESRCSFENFTYAHHGIEQNRSQILDGFPTPV